MTKEETKTYIAALDRKRIVLNSVLKKEQTIWGGVGDRDIEEETILTREGIVVEEKITEYGQFQKTPGGDIERKELHRYSLDESVEILLSNPVYLNLIKSNQ